jgi:hypothetical protein
MQRRTILIVLALAAVLGTAGAGSLALAQSGGGDFTVDRLRGWYEVPSVSTTGRGDFEAVIRQGELHYKLDYHGLEAPVQQAHIHLGQRDVNGSIIVFLCTNLGNGPAGTPECPGPSEGVVSGAVGADDVVGPAGQGIAAGEFAELLDALRANRTYANVHSEKFPGGEIRAQIVPVG